VGGFAAFVYGGLLLVGGAFALLGVRPSTDLAYGNVAPAVAVALLASWTFTRLESRPLASVGLPGGARALTGLARGAALGLLLIGSVVLAFVLCGWLRWSGDAEPGSPLLGAASLTALLAGAAFVEELLFRGYPFQVLEARFGAPVAISATSLVFGALHAANPNFAPLPAVNITLAGALLGVAYWRTRSLWFVTGLHLGWNWVMAVSELSVSGLPIDMPGYEPRLSGPVAWTGGAFGPEGGLLVTAVSILGTVWLWRSAAGRESLSRL